jgi:hypothetical protein
MGRHWEAQCHQGNLRFRNTITKYAYEKAKNGKAHIMQGVVEELKVSGSRFLKSKGAGYDKVPQEEASSAFCH